MIQTLFAVLALPCLATFFVLLAYWPSRTFGAILGLLYGGVALFLSIFLGPVVFVHAGVLALGTLVGALFEVRPRHMAFAGAVLAAATVGYAVVGMTIYRGELTALLEEYPEESLSARLNYEKEATGIEIPAGRSYPPYDQDPSEREKGLRRLENDLSGQVRGHREASLRTLRAAHESTVVAFERAQGFGMFRMPVLAARKEYIELPEPEPIPLKCERPANPPATTEPSDADERPHPPDTYSLTGDSPLAGLHRASYVDFSNANGFGLVEGNEYYTQRPRDLDRVIGFQSHGFRRAAPPVEANSARWDIQELQLVSLLKHQPPAAYSSQNLPRMEELKSAPTRPLDAFETAALGKLQESEDLVTREGAEEIRMLGSIRATSHCLECHRVERGALLGAFSYRLLRQ